MKILIYLSFFLSLNALGLVTIDKKLAYDTSKKIKEYQPLIKSDIPNFLVVYISDLTDPTFMRVEESNLIIGTDIIFIRPQVSYLKELIKCTTEKGVISSLTPTRVTISGAEAPLRILCFGKNGSYREAYSTFYKKPIVK